MLLTRRAGGLERNPTGLQILQALSNVSFLERPFHPLTLISMVRTALRARQRQYQTRCHLEELERQRARLEERVAERTRELSLSEARYRAYFEHFPECLFVVEVTADGRFLHEAYNPAGQRLTGLEPAAYRELAAKFEAFVEVLSEVRRNTSFRPAGVIEVKDRATGDRVTVDVDDAVRHLVGVVRGR